MEGFVVILLLFGAFSLGAATQEGMEAEPTNLEVPAAGNASSDGPDHVRRSENNDEAKRQDCSLNRQVIDRDLSRAHGHEIVPGTRSAGDCDGGCVDE